MSPEAVMSSLSAPAALTRKSVRYLRKNYRYLAADPGFFVMKTLARFELARSLATRPKSSLRALPTDINPHVVKVRHGVGGAIATLREEGYYVGFELDPGLVTELRETALSSVCYADRDRDLPFRIEQREQLEEKLGRKLKVASYFGQNESWPGYRLLESDPQLKAIARAYLGCEPVYLRSEVAWSFPSQPTRAEKIATAQVFHCDINDYKTLKFFFYLTDVGPEDGPHAYIKKEPRQRTLLHQLMGQRVASLPENKLLDTYGEQQVVTVCGKSGLGFVGDPYYFHRGATPTGESRLLLQIEVGCRRYRTWYFDI